MSSGGKMLWKHIQTKIIDLRKSLDAFQVQVNELLPTNEDREICVSCGGHTDRFERLSCHHAVCRQCLLGQESETIGCSHCPSS